MINVSWEDYSNVLVSLANHVFPGIRPWIRHIVQGPSHYRSRAGMMRLDVHLYHRDACMHPHRESDHFEAFVTLKFTQTGVQC